MYPLDISPQFHVIFDNKFETVNSLPSDQPLDKQWAYLFQLGRECFLDIDYDTNDHPILPSLSELLKQYKAFQETKRQDAPMTSGNFVPTEATAPCHPPTSSSIISPVSNTPTDQLKEQPNDTILPQDNAPDGEIQENIVSGGVDVQPHNIPLPNENGRPRRQNVGTYKDGPAIIHRLPIDDESYDFSFFHRLDNQEWEHPVPMVGNCGRTSSYHPTKKIQQSFLAECYLLQDNWFEDKTCITELTSNLSPDSWNTDEIYFNNVLDPRVLEARVKKSKYNKDNPSFDTATRGPFQDQFWNAMRLEFETLTKTFDSWEYVPNPGGNILPLVHGPSK